jgi:hypothetical protein
MADATMRVQGPVEIESTSPAHVAFLLMNHIARTEKDVPRSREYWLTLYHQCRKATSGLHTLGSILQE